MEPLHPFSNHPPHHQEVAANSAIDTPTTGQCKERISNIQPGILQHRNGPSETKSNAQASAAADQEIHHDALEKAKSYIKTEFNGDGKWRLFPISNGCIVIGNGTLLKYLGLRGPTKGYTHSAAARLDPRPEPGSTLALPDLLTRLIRLHGIVGEVHFKFGRDDALGVETVTHYQTIFTNIIALCANNVDDKREVVEESESLLASIDFSTIEFGGLDFYRKFLDQLQEHISAKEELQLESKEVKAVSEIFVEIVLLIRNVNLVSWM